MFSGAHLHLLLNHAPAFGLVFALALLTASYFFARDVLRRTAFVVLVAMAPLAVVTQRSGHPAEDAIRGFPGVRRDVIHAHEDMGNKAYLLSVGLGVVALAALVVWRKRPSPRGATLVITLATAFVSGAMVYTGLLGGRIRHTEVRPGAVKADAMTIEPPRRRSPPPAP